MLSALRLGLRSFVRHPRLMVLLTLTLALGIGANVAVFTVLDAVLLRPLPYPEPDRLVRVFESNDTSPRMGVSNPNFLDWRAQSTSFEALAAYSGGPTTVLGGREPVIADVYAVTQEFFTVLGTQAQVGRVFEGAEHRVGAMPAVVVSDPFWRDVLGADRALERLTLRVGPFACRVVGVMPHGFAFPEQADVYLPKELEGDDSGRTAHNLRVIGRLASGVPLERARTEMNTIAARIEAEHRTDNDAQRVAIVDLREQLVGNVRQGLLLLQMVVGLVLLAACANVAGGLLTRAAERQKEMAIRSALGAGRGLLIRHLLVEGMVLALAGGAVGALLAWVGVRLLRGVGPVWLPRLAELSLDGRVVTFVVLVSVAAALIFGTLPALQSACVDIRDALAVEGRGAATSVRTATRHVVVAIEVAMALTLLLGSALLLRSLAKVVDTDAGFDSRGVLTLDVALPEASYADGSAGAAFFDRALQRLAALPGVTAAGLTSALPLDGPSADGGFAIESRPELSTGDWQKGPTAGYRLASGDYFRALGIPILQGRSFTDADDPAAPPVAVVNQALAKRYFPGRDPIGQRVQFLGMDRENPWLTVVGVAADVRHDRLDRQPSPEVFVHYRQLPFRTLYGMVLVARAREGDVQALGPAARQAIRSLDPQVPLSLRRLDDVVRDSIGDRRLSLWLVGGFTLIALLLAMAGVYGVVNHVVIARTREMGIRMALGARPGSVVGLILRSSAVGLGAGLVGGLGGGLIAARALESFLVGISPTDAVSIGGAVGLLAMTALLAAWIPARRATRIDPVTALQ